MTLESVFMIRGRRQGRRILRSYPVQRLRIRLELKVKGTCCTIVVLQGVGQVRRYESTSFTNLVLLYETVSQSLRKACVS